MGGAEADSRRGLLPAGEGSQGAHAEARVAGTQFHVTQIRGFEKFTEGRPYYEMPSITARIPGLGWVTRTWAARREEPRGEHGRAAGRLEC